MDKYSMKIHEDGRRILSAYAMAGVATTRTLQMCYHIAKKYSAYKVKLDAAQKAKDATKIKKYNDWLQKYKGVFENYQSLAKIETGNIRNLQSRARIFLNIMHEQER